jgi:hypothetical protein
VRRERIKDKGNALIRKAQVDAIVDDNGLESFEVKP